MSEKYYEIDKIMQKRVINGNAFFEVGWKNFSETFNSWVPQSELTNCRELLKEFN